jgi:hypothetical protein
VRVLTVFVGDYYTTSSGFLQEKYAVIGIITRILPLIMGNNKAKIADKEDYGSKRL